MIWSVLLDIKIAGFSKGNVGRVKEVISFGSMEEATSASKILQFESVESDYKVENLFEVLIMLAWAGFDGGITADLPEIMLAVDGALLLLIGKAVCRDNGCFWLHRRWRSNVGLAC